jgi:hypothetical protein
VKVINQHGQEKMTKLEGCTAVAAVLEVDQQQPAMCHKQIVLILHI